MTWARERFCEAAAEAGLFSPDYAEDILVRLAHHSSALEGNTLTLGDSVTLLIDERAPAGRTMREVYEVVNHREALARVLSAVGAVGAVGEGQLGGTGDGVLSVALVREIHGALMDRLLPDRGDFKTSSNVIVGASFPSTPPERVPDAMRQWAEQADWQTRNLDGAALLEAIAAHHRRFEQIHPFSDGNGRVGRLVLAYQTLSRFGAPAIVTADLRSEYLTLLAAEDVTGLAALIARLLADELDRAPDPARPAPDSDPSGS